MLVLKDLSGGIRHVSSLSRLPFHASCHLAPISCLVHRGLIDTHILEDLDSFNMAVLFLNTRCSFLKSYLHQSHVRLTSQKFVSKSGLKN